MSKFLRSPLVVSGFAPELLPGFISVAPASGAPAYINQTDSSLESTTTTTFAHEVTADTDMLVLVIQGYDGGLGGTPTLSTVTYDGVGLTLVDDARCGNGGFDCATFIYYMAAPPVGTANVTVTFAANVVGRVQAINVANVSALDTSAVDEAVTPLEVGPTMSATSFIVGGLTSIRVGTTTYTWSTDVVEIQDLEPATNVTFAAGYRIGPGAETYTFTATPSAALLAGGLIVAAFI